MELVEQYQQWRRRGWKAVIAGIFIIIVAIIVMSLTIEAPAPDFNKLGIHLLLDDGRGSWDVDLWDEHMAVAGDMLPSDGYVVQLIRADELDTDKWQTFFDLARDHQLTPIIRLATTFDIDTQTWTAPLADADGTYSTLAQQYTDFLTGMNWHTDKHYIILLNEPNNGHEWGGKPNPAEYAQFVMDVASTIKAVDDKALILNAGFDLSAPDTGNTPFPDSEMYLMSANRFMIEMHEAKPQVFKQFDRWNSHAYPLHFKAPPWERELGFINMETGETELTNAPRTVYNRSVNGYEWELWQLKQFGIDGLPVMITETGWRHAESVSPDSLDAGEDYPSVEQVTEYLDLLLLGNIYGRMPEAPIGGWTGLLLDERVTAVIPFSFNGVPDEWGHTNWLEMSEDGEVIGEYPMVELFREYSRRQATDS